jgi:universal stress protein E
VKDFKKIMVGVDLGPELTTVWPGAQKAAQQAIWVALANGGSIQLVHSTHTDDYETPLPGAAGIVHHGLSDAGREALEALANEARNSGVETEMILTTGRPWFAITKLAMQQGTDLVIIGKRNESSEEGRRLGSNAIKLLRKCPTPVWVVRPEHDLVHRLVLAATDLTDVGDQSLAAACDIALRHECELNAVHAWSVPMDLQLESSRISEDDYAAELDKIKLAALMHMDRLIPVELKDRAELHAVKGNPDQAIRDAVAHLDPDLLVMGTVSRTGIAGLLVGSTAERMLDQVDCSILALKPDGFLSPVPS